MTWKQDQIERRKDEKARQMILDRLGEEGVEALSEDEYFHLHYAVVRELDKVYAERAKKGRETGRLAYKEARVVRDGDMFVCWECGSCKTQFKLWKKVLEHFRSGKCVA